jgi:hypothetical protein
MTMSFNSFAMPNFSHKKYKLRFILSRLAVSIINIIKNNKVYKIYKIKKGALFELIVINYGFYNLEALNFEAYAFLAGCNILYDLFLIASYILCKNNNNLINKFD